MKRKLIVILFVLFLLLVVSGGLYYVFHNKEIKSPNIKTEDIIPDKSSDEIKTVSNDKAENKVEQKEEIQNNEQKEEIKTKPQIKKNNDSTTQKQNTNTSVPKNETKTPEQPPKTEQPKQPEPVKEQTEWEKLGMTEDQYKNQPMYKYEHVDFSVEKYGSEAAATQACLEYGDRYQPALDGLENYNCSTVYSRSGRYLGEMFHTEKLN